MPLVKFLYPIGNYFFDFELLEVIKEITPKDISLKFRYSLENINPVRFTIPIHISHIAYLDCKAEQNFENDKSQSIYSDRVMDVQSNQIMYGYGDDHHVSFASNEKKGFLVLFKPSDRDFDTFDIEFFMKPEGEAYGLYRLRYNFLTRQVTNRYCLKIYEAPNTSFQPPTLISKKQFSLLFANALEIAAIQAEKQLNRAISHHFEIELHGAGKSGFIVSPIEAIDLIFLGEDRFYRIIDIAVIAVYPSKTRIFMRISNHTPSRFEDTWNQPSGTGPFKQIVTDQIRVYSDP
jgi:hypothetical protein